jgi:hypothetical protein
MAESGDLISPPTTPPSPAAGRLRAFCRSDAALVLGLTLLGLVLRLTGISFGLPSRIARPDEDFIVEQSFSLLRTKSPAHFDYPSAYIDLVALSQAIYYVGGRVTGHFAAADDVNLEWYVNPSTILRIDRGLSAFLGALAIPLVYWLGAGALGRRQGLLAACFVSVCYLHVRDSHFGTTDVMLALMCTAALLAIHRAADGSLRKILGAAIAVGLAISTKYNAAALALPLGMACFAGSAGRGAAQAFRHIAARALVCTVAVPLGFLLATPYVLWRWSDFVRDVTILFTDKTVAGPHLGIYAGRGWQHLFFSLEQGLGWPLFLAAMAGLIILLLQRRRSAFPIIAFAIAYWAQMASSLVVFVRYALPLVAPLCLLAAEAVTSLDAKLPERRRKVAFGVATALLLLLPLYRSVRLDWLLLQEDSRLLLLRWIEEKIPNGTTLALVGSRACHPPLLSHPDQIERLRLFWIDKKGGEGRTTSRYRDLVRTGSRPYYVRWRTHDEKQGWVDFDTGLPVEDRRPDYVIVPDYPILPPLFLRGGVGPWYEELLQTDYEMVYELHTLREGPMTADIQDAFFLPYAGLSYADRPGPGFRVYRRKGS